MYENFINICNKNNSNTIDYTDIIHDKTDIINNIECVNEELNLEDISISTNFEKTILIVIQIVSKMLCLKYEKHLCFKQ